MKKVLSTMVTLILIASMSITSLAASGDTTVYVTKTGEKYHVGSCSYLRQSKIPISLAGAVDQGYTACSRCKPPALTAPAAAETPAAPAPAAVAQPATETAAAATTATVSAPVPGAAAEAVPAAEPAPAAVLAPAASADPDAAVLDTWFAALSQIQAGYLAQYNLLVSQNAADSDPILAQRAALVNQTLALPSDQMIQQLSLVSLIQMNLSNAGCFTGEINGLMDLHTVQSLILYQQLNNLPATGTPDALTLQALGI